MIFEKVRKILSEQLGVDEDSIQEDSLLAEDLGADSLDAIDIVMSVEDEFGLEVPDEVVESMSTVSDIVKFIEDNK
ncbi:MAG: acyl carrier protein [Clostridiales bacterium]|uniref:Acyl carrier protein n=1 Tax=Candidatus Scybalenecus merdavium TaxID=2840939 RepID=A0A9D1MVL3_9FIRM|nr:acyl carrier protein [Clostridiales bacterium]HIU69878.1 acyl carrier protein [Candidatus Scubalenecus merdavium]